MPPHLWFLLIDGPSSNDLVATGICKHYSLPLPFQPYGVHGFPLLMVSKCLSLSHLSLNPAHASICGCFIKVSVAVDSVSYSDHELSCCLLVTLLMCALYLLLFLLISQIIRPDTFGKVTEYGVNILLAHPVFN